MPSNRPKDKDEPKSNEQQLNFDPTHVRRCSKCKGNKTLPNGDKCPACKGVGGIDLGTV